jgi:hypothetical protein
MTKEEDIEKCSATIIKITKEEIQASTKNKSTQRRFFIS